MTADGLLALPSCKKSTDVKHDSRILAHLQFTYTLRSCHVNAMPEASSATSAIVGFNVYWLGSLLLRIQCIKPESHRG